MAKKILLILLWLMLPATLYAGGLVTGKSRMRFEPGDKVLFSTDFRDCPVGEFPEGFDKFEKAMECVKYDEHIWIAPSTDNGMRLWKKMELGDDDFSISYDLLINPEKKKGTWPKMKLRVLTEGKSEKEWDKEAHPAVGMPYDVTFYGDRVEVGQIGRVKNTGHLAAKKLHFDLEVRRHQFRVFMEGKRLVSIPFKGKAHGFEFAVWESPAYGVLISDILVTRYTKKEAKPTPEKLGIGITKTKEGMKLTVPEKVLFDFNKFVLKSEAKEALSVVADIIRAHPARQIVVTGYTDNIGSDEYNLKLSLQRAQSVADYLIYCGKVESEIFRIEGKGKAEPVASNATEEGRAKNRRVEIRLISR